MINGFPFQLYARSLLNTNLTCSVKCSDQFNIMKAFKYLIDSFRRQCCLLTFSH